MDLKQEDDMPPDLEDLSEELNKIKLTRGDSKQNENSKIKVNVINPDRSLVAEHLSNNNIVLPVANKSELQEEKEFGSFMKKGFLKRINQDSKNKVEKDKLNEEKKVDRVEDLRHIKSIKENTQDMKFIENIKNEVKINKENTPNSIITNIIEKKDEWLTQELLMKIAQKPSLLKSFMDPRFTDIISLIQKDPKKAIAQYGHVEEFNSFIKEFSALMAEHFNKLGKKNENSTQFDQETEEIMKDPKISAIIYKLQIEGKIDMEEMQRDPNVAIKVKKLIDKGVFRLQRESDLK